MYKVGKQGMQRWRAGLAEQTTCRAGVGSKVAMGSNPTSSLDIFFSSTFENFLSVLVG